jgi:hypothetical protein
MFEAERILKNMGLPATFLLDIYREKDDWSFIIKLHALIEGVSTHLLVSDLDDERLSDVIAHLEMSNTRAGKVAFLKALGLMDSDDRAYVAALSELRNALVHRVENVNFNLEADDGGPTSAPRDRLLKSTEKFWKPVIELNGAKVQRAVFVSENRRLTIWMRALLLIETFGPNMPSKDDTRAQLVRALMKSSRIASNKPLKNDAVKGGRVS